MSIKPRPKQAQQPIKTKENITTSQWELRVRTSTMLEARENAPLVSVLNLIGGAGGMTFLDQPQSEEKQNQTKAIPPSLENCCVK